MSQNPEHRNNGKNDVPILRSMSMIAWRLKMKIGRCRDTITDRHLTGAIER